MWEVRSLKHHESHEPREILKTERSLYVETLLDCGDGPSEQGEQTHFVGG